MNQNRLPDTIHFLILAWLGLSLCGTYAGADEGCVSAACHAELLKGENVHAVAEGCDTCHVASQQAHPSKGKSTFTLSEEPPGLCNTCHQELGGKSHVHSPVQEGACTLCHNPHSSSQASLLVDAPKDLCTTCHSDVADFKVTHGPVSTGACTACHDPHESEHKALLQESEEKLCVSCHTDMSGLRKQKHVHPALDGGCTSCHNPHGSDAAKLLPEVLPALCFLCHSEVEEKLEAAVPHVPAISEGGCVSCHSPHASDHARLLIDDQKPLCLSCHDGVIDAGMKVLHGPIKEAKCSACHDPHGNAQPALLAHAYPAELYVPYTDRAYAFCFQCHNRDLLQYAKTSFATNFRDGEKNLHFVHVNNPRKGRSCRMCHNVHGGGNEKLIADQVSFGSWKLPLNFIKTETGGGCSPGCHKPLYYDRKSPGRKPKA